MTSEEKRKRCGDVFADERSACNLEWGHTGPHSLLADTPEPALVEQAAQADLLTTIREIHELCENVERALAPSVPTKPEPAEFDARALADCAYCDYINQMARPECLGFAAKIKTGEFGEAELNAHIRAGELLGRHRAFAEVVAYQAGRETSKEALAEAEKFQLTLRNALDNTTSDEKVLWWSVRFPAHLARLLDSFAAKARLEEAKWWFTDKWGSALDWRAVIENPLGYLHDTVQDAKRIVQLQQEAGQP